MKSVLSPRCNWTVAFSNKFFFNLSMYLFLQRVSTKTTALIKKKIQMILVNKSSWLIEVQWKSIDNIYQNSLSLELVMDREAWGAAIHGVIESWTWLATEQQQPKLQVYWHHLSTPTYFWAFIPQIHLHLMKSGMYSTVLFRIARNLKHLFQVVVGTNIQIMEWYAAVKRMRKLPSNLNVHRQRNG